MRLTSFVVAALFSFTAFAQATTRLEGTLEERLDSGGYSYLRLKTAKGEKWAAVPQVSVEKGATVTVEVQNEMQNFQSPSLKRSWPVIAFGTVPEAAEPARAQPQPMKNPHGEGGIPMVPPATPTLEGTVLETIDTGTYTYLRLSTRAGETWAAVPRAEVTKGATVRIRSPQNMDGFNSPSLKRTFEKIVFGTLEK